MSEDNGAYIGTDGVSYYVVRHIGGKEEYLGKEDDGDFYWWASRYERARFMSLDAARDKWAAYCRTKMPLSYVEGLEP